LAGRVSYFSYSTPPRSAVQPLPAPAPLAPSAVVPPAALAPATATSRMPPPTAWKAAGAASALPVGTLAAHLRGVIEEQRKDVGRVKDMLRQESGPKESLVPNKQAFEKSVGLTVPVHLTHFPLLFGSFVQVGPAQRHR